MEKQRKDFMHQTTENKGNKPERVEHEKKESKHKTHKTKSIIAVKANDIISFVTRQRFSGYFEMVVYKQHT